MNKNITIKATIEKYTLTNSTTYQTKLAVYDNGKYITTTCNIIKPKKPKVRKEDGKVYIWIGWDLFLADTVEYKNY